MLTILKTAVSHVSVPQNEIIWCPPPANNTLYFKSCFKYRVYHSSKHRLRMQLCPEINLYAAPRLQTNTKTSVSHATVFKNEVMWCPPSSKHIAFKTIILAIIFAIPQNHGFACNCFQKRSYMVPPRLQTTIVFQNTI